MGPLQGSRYQQNGYHGARPLQLWILPTPLPRSALVDRSLCSEGQLLSGLCSELAGPETAEGLLRGVRGWLRLYVTGAPCLSCVGAMRQFQLLLPGVSLSVCIGEELQHHGAR
mmetsp:Transcript_22996/g.72385  ORF Transcript_22996/g.72385 Transcript_22996/m.72385 type:complete len:113 (-) Transcript_22996:71-409(-)